MGSSSSRAAGAQGRAAPGGGRGVIRAGLFGWLVGWFIQASQLSRDQGAWEERRAGYDSSKEVPT